VTAPQGSQPANVTPDDLPQTAPAPTEQPMPETAPQEATPPQPEAPAQDASPPQPTDSGAAEEQEEA
jgi:hypothetical protein